MSVLGECASDAEIIQSIHRITDTFCDPEGGRKIVYTGDVETQRNFKYGSE